MEAKELEKKLKSLNKKWSEINEQLSLVSSEIEKTENEILSLKLGIKVGDHIQYENQTKPVTGIVSRFESGMWVWVFKINKDGSKSKVESRAYHSDSIKKITK